MILKLCYCIKNRFKFIFKASQECNASVCRDEIMPIRKKETLLTVKMMEAFSCCRMFSCL